MCELKLDGCFIKRISCGENDTGVPKGEVVDVVTAVTPEDARKMHGALIHLENQLDFSRQVVEVLTRVLKEAGVSGFLVVMEGKPGFIPTDEDKAQAMSDAVAAIHAAMKKAH